MSFEVDIEEAGKSHSPTGPSGTKRWKNCLGSVALIKKLGDKARKAGRPAKEGTAGHTILQECLTGGEDAWEHLGQKIIVEDMTFVVDQEMVDGVQMAIDWTREQLAKYPGAYLLVEESVRSVEDPDASGTADIVIVVPGVKLIVADFKYGIFIPVEPDDEQLKSYGHYTFDTFQTFANIMSEEEFAKYNPEAHDNGVNRAKMEVFPDRHTPVELYIIQPRCHGHDSGHIRRYDTTRSELARWFYGEILPAIHGTREKNAPLKCGDWCNFCAGSDHCPKLANAVKEYPVEADPVTLSNDELDQICVIGEAIIKQHERNRAELFRRAMAGLSTPFPNWKLVRKLGDRIWKEGADTEASKLLGPDAFTNPELKTPPQIEKIKGDKSKVAKDFVAKWAMKPETGLTIAPRKDKREEQTTAMGAYDKAMGNEQEPKA